MFPFMNLDDQKQTEDVLAVALLLIMNMVFIWYNIHRITIAVEQHAMMPPHRHNKRGRKY